MSTKNKSIIDTHNVVTPAELYQILSMQLDRMQECPEDIKIMAPESVAAQQIELANKTIAAHD